MSESFATTFGTGKFTIGQDANNNGQTTFTGSANNTAAVQNLVVTGSIDQPGSTVTIVANFQGGGSTAPTQATYVGFSGTKPNGPFVYYFSGSFADTNGVAAVSSVAAPAPGTPTAVNTNAETAPDDPAITCFTTGTHIRTTRGEVAVEDLVAGDLAVTSSGAHRPIRWIGHRTMDPRRHANPHDAQPVRIRAGAFGDGKPARDLRVSPGHSIAVDVLGEVLIPAISLVNGVTILQEAVESVTYWHVELDSHDLLVAEGLAAESYLDMGNRGFFAEAGVIALAAGPDADAARRTHADFCRPYYAGGPIVEAVRTRLRLRAEAQGWRLDLPAPFAGAYLEVDGRRVPPRTRGLAACFALPADAREVWLVSPVSVPREVGDNPDARALGLCLTGLRLDDGLSPTRAVALDDPLLCLGFHEMEPGQRWTAARARLPAALWAGLEDTVLLRLELAGSDLPRWSAPEFDTAAPEAVAA